LAKNNAILDKLTAKA